ncbi:CHAP domain-containing protein [Paenibacillus harenae]|uniref:CHAP domain-containing protein n=1 Tax=Paenibacillus harenae TaxID=306543 RepID=UPI002792852B|nr:CHAP domain-containing protein [Paenibacillus harenae]MDQ0062520.1 hypothetical protein [Paenibacillus harenae]
MNGERRNTRLDSVRFVVQDMIMSIPCETWKQEACAHLYGVSAFASMLAMKRNLNQELAAIAGLLHNYYFYKTGIPVFPGPNSSEAVRPLLRDMNILTKEEQITILQAIFYQEERNRTHGPFGEVVKDACILQCFFQDTGRDVTPQDALRLQNMVHELAIPFELPEKEYTLGGDAGDQQDTGRRSKLADIAETLAGSNIVGVPGDRQYRGVCKYWPDAAIYRGLQNSWCAAFVYHCCWEAGFLMPIRYPNGNCRFAGVGAWLEWAQLAETGFLGYDGQEGFTPQRGDIVIYEKLLSDDSHDHIGIILACNEEEIWVAEGNRDNQNYSSVFNRDRWHCILGYIRIDNDYTYHFDGDYSPII